MALPWLGQVTDAEAFPRSAFLRHHECRHEIVADGILRVLVVQELPRLDPYLMIMHSSGYGKNVGKPYLEKTGCSNIFCLQSNFFHVYEYTEFKWSSELEVSGTSCQWHVGTAKVLQSMLCRYVGGSKC